jgi:hypothetical protein
MIRKIIINLITALVFFPLVLLGKRWENILYGNYQYYDTHYTTLKEYISVLLYLISYPLTSFIFLIFILLPFQLIKDYHYKNGKKTSYIKKVGILTLIITGFIIFIGTFNNIWTHPLWHNFIYVFYSLFLSLIFTTILYFLIDRYVERNYN